MATQFHLAFSVHDLEAARRFYVDLLGCKEGRSALEWIDFDFFGHQLSAHLVADGRAAPRSFIVDATPIPLPHFGVVLAWHDWHALAARLREHEIQFLLEPRIRFAGLAGEQATLFIQDPSGNALEFKAFQEGTALFAG